MLMGQLDGIRVLIIEDNADLRGLMAVWVASTGATVCEAADGAEALDLARTDKPHVIYCDLKMPGMDGFGFMQRLLQEPDLCRVPVFVVSGEIGPAAILQTWHAGFSGHLVKPVTKEAILAQLNRVFWAHSAT